MGFFGFLKRLIFGKKKEKLPEGLEGLPPELEAKPESKAGPEVSTSAESVDLGLPAREELPEKPSFEPATETLSQEKYEVIKTKLDLIASKLENIERRLAALEKLAEES